MRRADKCIFRSTLLIVWSTILFAMYTHTHTHTLASGERSEAVYTCTQAYKFQGVNVTASYKHQYYTSPGPPVKPLSAHEGQKNKLHLSTHGHWLTQDSMICDFSFILSRCVCSVVYSLFHSHLLHFQHLHRDARGQTDGLCRRWRHKQTMGGGFLIKTNLYASQTGNYWW